MPTRCPTLFATASDARPDEAMAMKIDGTRSNDRAIEMVLGYYNAFNRGDWDGMLALLGEDVVHDLEPGPA